MKTVLILKLAKNKYFSRHIIYGVYEGITICADVKDAYKFSSEEELYGMYHTNYEHVWRQMLETYPKHELITKLVIGEEQ
jgi:hypothetical protein